MARIERKPFPYEFPLSVSEVGNIATAAANSEAKIVSLMALLSGEPYDRKGVHGAFLDAQGFYPGWVTGAHVQFNTLDFLPFSFGLVQRVYFPDKYFEDHSLQITSEGRQMLTILGPNLLELSSRCGPALVEFVGSSSSFSNRTFHSEGQDYLPTQGYQTNAGIRIKIYQELISNSPIRSSTLSKNIHERNKVVDQNIESLREYQIINILPSVESIWLDYSINLSEEQMNDIFTGEGEIVSIDQCQKAFLEEYLQIIEGARTLDPLLAARGEELRLYFQSHRSEVASLMNKARLHSSNGHSHDQTEACCKLMDIIRDEPGLTMVEIAERLREIPGQTQTNSVVYRLLSSMDGRQISNKKSGTKKLWYLSKSPGDADFAEEVQVV